MSDALFPDGIRETHVPSDSGIARYLTWLPLFVLGAVLAAALLGVFGGGRNTVLRDVQPAGALTIDAPATLRNGEFFEMYIGAEAGQAIAEPAIAISASYWRDATINTVIPAPAAERYEDGYFVFEFDPMEPGEAVQLKVAGQINPSMFAGTRGVVLLRDADRVLAQVPVRLRVLP